jgi:antitoxin component YwqK of YwqJK toxin-antitoxin module
MKIEDFMWPCPVFVSDENGFSSITDAIKEISENGDGFEYENSIIITKRALNNALKQGWKINGIEGKKKFYVEQGRYFQTEEYSMSPPVDISLDEGEEFQQFDDNTVIEYHDNGKSKEQYTKDEEGNLNGPFISWYESGKLREKGEYRTPKNSYLSTIWSLKAWQPQGEACPHTCISDGKGRRIVYHLNGSVSLDWSYDRGKLHGEQRSWSNKGIKSSITNYEYGNQIGTQKHWWENGKKCKEEIISEDGSMIYSLWYDNGKIHEEGKRKPRTAHPWTVDVWKIDGSKCHRTNLKNGNGNYVEYSRYGHQTFFYIFKKGEVLDKCWEQDPPTNFDLGEIIKVKGVFGSQEKDFLKVVGKGTCTRDKTASYYGIESVIVRYFDGPNYGPFRSSKSEEYSIPEAQERFSALSVQSKLDDNLRKDLDSFDIDMWKFE